MSFLHTKQCRNDPSWAPPSTGPHSARATRKSFMSFSISTAAPRCFFRKPSLSPAILLLLSDWTMWGYVRCTEAFSLYILCTAGVLGSLAIIPWVCVYNCPYWDTSYNTGETAVRNSDCSQCIETFCTKTFQTETAAITIIHSCDQEGSAILLSRLFRRMVMSRYQYRYDYIQAVLGELIKTSWFENIFRNKVEWNNLYHLPVHLGNRFSKSLKLNFVFRIRCVQTI